MSDKDASGYPAVAKENVPARSWMALLLTCACLFALWLCSTGESPVTWVSWGIGPSTPVLQESTWNPALIGTLQEAGGSETPIWVFGLATTLLLALLLKHFSPPVRLAEWVFLLGISLSGALPVQLLLVSVAWLILLRSNQFLWKFVLLVGWTILAAAFLSPDFGLVVLLLVAFTVDEMLKERSMHARGVVMLLLACVVALGVWWIWPSWFYTLARPITAFFQPATSAFSSLNPIWNATLSDSEILLLLALLLSSLAWFRIRQQSTPVTFGTFLLIGLSSVYYLSTATLVILLLNRQVDYPISRPQAAWWCKASVTAAVLMTCLFMRWQSLLSSSGHHHLTPERWNIRANVLLADLNDAGFWRRPSRMDFKLVADAQWQHHLFDLHEYAAVCNDVISFRPEYYRRNVGGDGGYTRTVKSWNLGLVVVPTDRLTDLRQLSLNPQCQLVAVDEHRCVFAWRENRSLAGFIAQATRELKTLEWPGINGSQANNYCRFADRQSRFAVAEALCAVRLPFASLKVLPEWESSEVHRVKGLALLEICHRQTRHSGRPTLFFLARAVHHSLRGFPFPLPITERRLRTANALQSVGLSEAEQMVTDPLRSVPWRLLLRSNQRNQLVSLSQEGIRAEDQDESPAVTKLAASLTRGDLAAARRVAGEIAGPTSSYYTWLTESVPRPSEESATALLQLLTRNNQWPPEMQAQAWYELGCLGLELGDHRLAMQSFQRSRGLDPEASYTFLRNLHLQMLASNPKR